MWPLGLFWLLSFHYSSIKDDWMPFSCLRTGPSISSQLCIKIHPQPGLPPRPKNYPFLGKTTSSLKMTLDSVRSAIPFSKDVTANKLWSVLAFFIENGPVYKHPLLLLDVQYNQDRYFRYTLMLWHFLLSIFSLTSSHPNCPFTHFHTLWKTLSKSLILQNC